MIAGCYRSLPRTLSSLLLARAGPVRESEHSINFLSHVVIIHQEVVLLIQPTGTAFAAKYCDYNFTSGSGVNQPTAFKEANSRLVEASKLEGRDVGALVLFMIIADETDEAAHAKFELYNQGTDTEALAWMKNQSGKDEKADKFSTAQKDGEYGT